MPRNISAALKAKMQTDSFSMATMVTITRRDGIVLAFTSWDVPFVYGGLTFQPTASLQSKSVKQTASSGTDSLDVQGIIDTVLITDSDLINGKYDGALVLLQEIDPTDLGAGPLTLLKGYSGELTISEGSYVGEVRSKSQLMTQEFGDVCSGNCRVNQLGDSDCAPGGSFANGNTMASYRQSGTITATGVTVDASVATTVAAVNCGGPAVGIFSADTGSTGGTTTTTSNSINTAYQNSAPASIYQSYRQGLGISNQTYGTNFSYTINGLTANQVYRVRLHWAETYLPTADQVHNALPAVIDGRGMRLFDVVINNNILLEQYDITSQAGGKNIAVNKELNAQARSDGSILLQFNSDKGNAMICGIEVINLPSSGITQGFGLNSSPNQASGVFNYGKITFTSGLNIGLAREIKNHFLSGSTTQIGLQEQFPYKVAVGDTATLEWGCDRLPSTCRSKFANLINIQCEPYVPGNDQLIATGRPPS